MPKKKKKEIVTIRRGSKINLAKNKPSFTIFEIKSTDFITILI